MKDGRIRLSIKVQYKYVSFLLLFIIIIVIIISSSNISFNIINSSISIRVSILFSISIFSKPDDGQVERKHLFPVLLTLEASKKK